MTEETSKFDDQARLMGALAHPIRLGVLVSLLEGPRIVGDLVQRFGEDQTKISKHLAILRRAGLVRCAADGRCRVYSLADRRTVQRILGCLDRMRPGAA